MRLGAFEQVLGPATTVQSGYSAGELRQEYIFVDPLFYVQAITDADLRLVRFAVTSRALRFRPRFIIGRNSGEPMEVKLNKHRFGTLAYTPTRVMAEAGARRRWYVEHYWLGNPGDYQDFQLAIVDAAPSVHDDTVESRELEETLLGLPPGAGSFDEAAVVQPPVAGFRAATAPNTYGETQPNAVADPFPIGVDLDEVRILR